MIIMHPKLMFGEFTLINNLIGNRSHYILTISRDLLLLSTDNGIMDVKIIGVDYV